MFSQVKFLYMMCKLNSWTTIVLMYLTISQCNCATFRVAWMAPDKNSGYKINSFTSATGLKLALQNVMSNPGILNGHNIEIEYFPTDCTAKGSTQTAMKAKLFNPDVMIGPPCREGMRVVAQLCAYWNLPVFSWYNPSIEFDNVQGYPTLVRMDPSLSDLGTSLLHLFRQNKWKQFSLIHDDESPWSLYEDAVRSKIAQTEVQLLSSDHVNSTVTDADLSTMFSHIKRYSYIVVFACPPEDIRRYMLIAERAGMGNGDYIFIQLDYQLYTESALNSEVLTKRRWMKGDSQDQAAKRIFKSLIHVLLDPMNDDATPTYSLPRNRYDEFTSMALPDSTTLNPGWKIPAGGPPDVYSLYLYDCILVWSVLVDRLHSAGVDYRDGKLLVKKAKNFLADGATGYFTLNDNQDRTAKIFMLYMTNDGSFKPSQILKFNSTNGYGVVNLKPLTEQLRTHGSQRISTKSPALIVQNTTTPTPTNKTHSTLSPSPNVPTEAILTSLLTPSIPPPPPVLQQLNPQKQHGEQTTIALINKLIAKVQLLEKTIKEHQLHSHVNVPDHTHTPHPLLRHLITTPLSILGSAHSNNVAGLHHINHHQHLPNSTPLPLSLQNILGHVHHPHVPHHLPTQATNHAHPVTGMNQSTRMNATDMYGHNLYQHHWHPHPHPHPPYPYQGQGHHGPIHGSHLPRGHLPTTQRPTTQAPTTTKTLPTTTARPTTKPPANTQEQNGNTPIDEALLDRISSRIVDRLTGTTGPINTNKDGTVGDWFTNNLEEAGPGLYFAAQAIRQRQLARDAANQILLRQQMQTNNANNQHHNNQNNIQSQSNAGWHTNAYPDPVLDPLAGLWGPPTIWR